MQSARRENGLYILDVDVWFYPAVQVLELSSTAKKPDGGLVMATGKDHEFVKNQCFCLAALLKYLGRQDSTNSAILALLIGSFGLW